MKFLIVNCRTYTIQCSITKCDGAHSSISNTCIAKCTAQVQVFCLYILLPGATLPLPLACLSAKLTRSSTQIFEGPGMSLRQIASLSFSTARFYLLIPFYFFSIHSIHNFTPALTAASFHSISLISITNLLPSPKFSLFRMQIKQKRPTVNK